MSQPVMLESHTTGGTAVTKPLVIDPILSQGATENWSPKATMDGVNDFVSELQGLLAADEVNHEIAYMEYVHDQLLDIEHAVMTDFQVGINRALRKFGMTPGEMLGAAVLHEGSGEHEMVPA